MDKLQKLKDILQPTPENRVKTVPEQSLVKAPRARTTYVYTPNLTPEQTPKATTPRGPMKYAIPQRVPTPTKIQDATEFVYPERGIWNEQTKEPEKPPSPKVQMDKPQRLSQI